MSELVRSALAAIVEGGTLSSGSSTCRIPITTRSTSLIAVTRSSGGSVAGSTASEW